MRRPPHRDHDLQLNLFHPLRNGPEWRDLPMAVKEQARLLLAQMLRMNPVSLPPRNGTVENRGTVGDE